MNLTRDVITDLLPVYFSGEASEDTKRLVEDYFREDPDFERIARRAATPLETLHRTAPVASETRKEKRDLECAREELFRRRLAFGAALLFTGAPLTAVYSRGHLVWSAILNDPWELALLWSFAALCWVQYFVALSRRTVAFVFGMFATLFPLVSASHLFLPGWRENLTHRLAVGAVMWIAAVVIWVQYFRLRRTAGGETAKLDRQWARERLVRAWLFFGLIVLLTGLLIFRVHLSSPGWPTDLLGVLWLVGSVIWSFQLRRVK